MNSFNLGDTIYMEDAVYHGEYTLVYITDTIYPEQGINFIYLDYGVWVEQNE